MKANTFQFRPGWVILDRSTARGGVKYDRQLIEETPINHRNGLQADHMTRKTVDHVAFCTTIDALVKRVDYVLRKHCTNTDLGWVADNAALRKVEAEIDELKIEAHKMNTEGAARAKSERRAEIRIVPLRLDFDREEAVQAITGTIRGVLTELRDALRAGDIASLHKLKLRAKNLEKLAVGFQSDAIRFALECAAQAATQIRTTRNVATRAVRKKGQKDEKITEAGRAAAARVGEHLDLEALEAAIAHFQPSLYDGIAQNLLAEAIGDD